MTNKITMEGTIFPIGKLNKNGWGIPDDENVIESVIESMKSAKLRICAARTGESEHHCDFSNDDSSNIGKIIDIWRMDNEIRGRVEVTKEDAIENFINHSYARTWSPYGHGVLDKDGWVKDKFEGKSLTFVNTPAWTNSGVDALYASHSGLQTYSDFNLVGNDTSNVVEPSFLEVNEEKKLFASESAGENFESLGVKMPENNVIDDIEDNIEDGVENPEDGNSLSNETLNRLEELYKAKTEQDEKIETLTKLLEEKNNVGNKPEPEEEDSKLIPASKVEDMVNSAILREREKVNKEVAVSKYKDLCDKIGIEVKQDDIVRFNSERLTADDINREADSILNVYSKFNKTAFSANKEPSYSTQKKNEKRPEDYQNRSGMTVGTPDMW